MKFAVQKRNVLRKKVKDLLNSGEIPGVIYGPKRKQSLNIQFDAVTFEKIFKDVGYSKLMDLEIEGEKDTKKVIIREVQHDPVKDNVIHVSFYELDLTKPMTTDVPVETTGQSMAVVESVGFLVVPFDTLEVRCLPDKLPEKLVIDISNLNEIGDNVPISDLKLPEGVELTSEVDEHATLAYIAPPQKEIVEEVEEVEEEGEEAEEGEEGEVAEGEEAEGEEKEGEEKKGKEEAVPEGKAEDAGGKS
ncbi:50S ribosomal protein L25 [Candidatus Dojkabacteria bacterium]|nr:50S ribosomal protein L25 [Candidatus Dojkabacteria bacterium]